MINKIINLNIINSVPVSAVHGRLCRFLPFIPRMRGWNAVQLGSLALWCSVIGLCTAYREQLTFISAVSLVHNIQLTLPDTVYSLWKNVSVLKQWHWGSIKTFFNKNGKSCQHTLTLYPLTHFWFSNTLFIFYIAFPIYFLLTFILLI